MRPDLNKLFTGYPSKEDREKEKAAAQGLFDTLTKPEAINARVPLRTIMLVSKPPEQEVFKGQLVTESMLSPIKLLVKHVVPKKPKPEKVRAYDRQKGICPYCDIFISDIMQMTWDHIVPSSKGGSNSITNKILVCDPCNQTKSNCSTFLEAAEKAGLATQKAFDVQQRALRLLALMKRLKDKGIIKS